MLMNTPANTPANKLVKYRPVLTSVQILHILAVCKREQPLSDASLSVISTLSVFKAKIDNAGVKPAYSSRDEQTIAAAKQQQTLMELGTDKPSLYSLPTPSVPATADYTATSKEDYWEQCYIKYTDDPALCNLEELAAATEHMYLNDLMTSEQEAAHELNLEND